MKRYMVTAVPGDDQPKFSRAGQDFTREPREITVREPAEGETLGPDEVTPEQWAQIEAEPRLKVTTASGKPVNEAAKQAAAAERAADATAPHSKK